MRVGLKIERPIEPNIWDPAKSEYKSSDWIFDTINNRMKIKKVDKNVQWNGPLKPSCACVYTWHLGILGNAIKVIII